MGEKVTRADLDDVTITGKGSGSVGVYALGAETMTMTLTGVKISNVDKGVYARGKVVTISGGTRIEGVKEYGVYVEGAVKDVRLDDVTITGKGSGSRYGVYARGEVVTISGGEIKEVKEGIVMMGKGTLEVKKGTTISLADSGKYGVYVGIDVTKATLEGTVIKGKGSGKGVYVEGYGSGKTGEVKLEGVTISKVTTGVEVKSGKSLMISGINGKNSTINFVGDGVGVKVGEKVTRATLTETVIKGNGSSGIGVHAMGKMVMISGGEISQVKTGVMMMGNGTLTLKDKTRIEFTGDYGVYVAGGKALLEQVKIEGSNQATGLYVRQGAVRLKNTTLRDVAMGMTISQGVVMMEGGALEFTDRYGISVSGGQAVLSGFKIIKKGNKDTDKSTGVWVDNLGKVMMREVDISGVQMGAYVMETGLLVMDKGSIDFKGEYGIYTSLQNSP